MKSMRTKAILPVVGLALAAFWLGWQYAPTPGATTWQDWEVAMLKSLSLDSLPPPPPSPGNQVADNVLAAELGQRIFFDTRFSSTGTVSCASCHQPEKFFTDQLPLAIGVNQATRNTMGLIGAAYSPWFFWDGRKDSLWSQALAPIENPLEHNSSRSQVAHLIASTDQYRQAYQRLFGNLPDIRDETRFPADATPLGSQAQQASWQSMTTTDQHQINEIFANTGKVLAAYQRKLLPAPAPFDDFVAQLASGEPGTALSAGEQAGLRLFLNKAQCINCHNGPLFTNNAFHNTGVLPPPGELPAPGRSEGLRLAQNDPFNCLGAFSDATADQCSELRFAREGDELIGAQRTASLRNLAHTAPYMHAGQITTLSDVIEHYNQAEESIFGHNEAKPLRLRAIEKRQLMAFLQSLNGGISATDSWLQPPD